MIVRLELPLITNRKGRLQRGNRVAFGPEFVAEVEIIAGTSNGATDAGVVEFLAIIQVATVGVAGGVEVADPFDVLADGADDIAFHDLHVVDVIEQFDPWAVDPLTDRHAPRGMIALIAGVIDLGVEQFQVEVDALRLGIGRNPPQPVGHGFNRLDLALVGLTIAAKADETRNAVAHGNVNRGFQFIFNAVMIAALVQAIIDPRNKTTC